MFHRFCQKSKTGTFHLGKCNCFFLLHYFRKRPQRKQGLFNKTALLAKPCPYGSLEWTNQALLALERAFWKGSTCLKGEGWREVYVLSQMPLNPTHWSFNRHMFILSLCSALHSFLTSCLISLLNPYFSLLLCFVSFLKLYLAVADRLCDFRWGHGKCCMRQTCPWTIPMPLVDCFSRSLLRPCFLWAVTAALLQMFFLLLVLHMWPWDLSSQFS